MIILPWPPKELNPNKRMHWTQRNPHKVAYRDACHLLIYKAKLTVSGEGPIPFTVDFYPPDKRHRDADNMISSFKAGQDGIANALGVNDRRFKPLYRFNEPIKGGRIVVTIGGAA